MVQNRNVPSLKWCDVSWGRGTSPLKTLGSGWIWRLGGKMAWLL